MGQPKEHLPFGEETLLERMVGIVGRVVSQVVVVAGAETELPDLGDHTRIARDPVADLGPLQGMATGLLVLADQTDAAFVTSCDVPMLMPDVVSRVIDALGDADAAAVRQEGRWHPLTAVYRTGLGKTAQERVDKRALRATDFLVACEPAAVDAEDLRDVDPELHSLMNVNTPEAYEAILRLAGFS